jgi:hypothetical protein
VKAPVEPVVSEPTTALGNGYGKVLWRPQVALLVNEATLYPVLMPLAPAATLMDRFPEATGQTLKAHGVPQDFIETETTEMSKARCSSLEAEDLVTLALRLSETRAGLFTSVT